MLFLSEHQILQYLEWKGLVSNVEAALVEISATNGSGVPARNWLPVNNGQLMFLTMPGYSQNTLCCKLLTFPWENDVDNQVRGSAVLVVFNANTGVIRAIMEAGEITAWRTAAGSVVALKHLGRNQDFRGKTLSVLGAGTQGRIHIKAFQHFFQFGKVNLWNRTRSRAEAVKAELKNAENIEITVNLDAKDCVKNADVVIWAASESREIYISKSDVKPGTLIISVGTAAAMPSGLSAEIFQNAQLFTENARSTKSEMSTFIQRYNLQFHELGEIISGIRSLKDSTNFIVYQSLGSAAMDAAAAKFILDIATQTN